MKKVSRLLLEYYLYEYIINPLRIVVSNRKSCAGLVLLLGFVALAIYGAFIHVDLTTHPDRAFIPPTIIRLITGVKSSVPWWKYPLGTDWKGRDILGMLAKGAAPLLEASLCAGLITVVVGMCVGLTAGYLGGFADRALMWVTDVFLNIPSLPLYVLIGVLMLKAQMQFNPFLVAAVVSVTAWAGIARAIRSQVLALKTQPFVELARSLGMPTAHIVFREILPNVAGYIAINFIFSTTGAIYAITGLFFLGALPINPTQWGVMLNDAWKNVFIFGPGLYYLVEVILALALLQVSFVLLSYGLDEIFNPRIRERYFKSAAAKLLEARKALR
ncbi:MAG: ABC transporter permease [Crenarchaeota archaeon]|nr:ABC transporter permease [Thermoproteota archaeon]